MDDKKKGDSKKSDKNQGNDPNISREINKNPEEDQRNPSPANKQPEPASEPEPSQSGSKQRPPADNQTQPKQEPQESQKKEHPDNVTADAIKETYRPKFEALEQQAESRLNQLLRYAYQEYQEKKENGEEISYGYFYQKYKAAAKKLEEKVDVVFYRLYDQLVAELKKHGFSEKDAHEVKEYYEERKSERRSAILKKIAEKF